MSHRGVRGVLGVVVVLIMAGLYNMQVEATSNATLEALTQYMDRRAANVRALTTKVEDLWTLRCGRVCCSDAITLHVGMTPHGLTPAHHLPRPGCS